MPTDWRETLKEFAEVVDDYDAHNDFFDLSEAVDITKGFVLVFRRTPRVNINQHFQKKKTNQSQISSKSTT